MISFQKPLSVRGRLPLIAHYESDVYSSPEEAVIMCSYYTARSSNFVNGKAFLQLFKIKN